MAVANFEGSLLAFPGASGLFTHTIDGRLNYGAPLDDVTSRVGISGLIIAQAVQSVSINTRVPSTPIGVIGHTGNAGYSRQATTTDVTIEAIITSGQALGKSLISYESAVPGNLTLDTTDGQSLSSVGRRVVVSGLALTSLGFNFNANGNATFSTSWTGDGDTYSPLTSPVGMDTDVEHTPMLWHEIKIGSPVAGLIVLSGLQTASFQGTINRGYLYEIGTQAAIDKPVTHPNTVTVSLNSLSNSAIIQSWLDKFTESFDPSNTATLVTIKVTRQDNATQDWIVASGLIPDSKTLNVAVGNNSTVDLTFTGSDMYF